MALLGGLVDAAAGAVDAEALLAEIQADAERALGAGRTVEEEAQGMEAVREAAVEFGDNAKAHGWHGWAGSMARRFQRFLAAHGERLEFDAQVGPTVEHCRRFYYIVHQGGGTKNFPHIHASR